ncbi:MAG: septum site-determining protein MinD [Thiotrichales bacterium]|nr:septum site-determining protein MinD [Thiotrichales bacterium]
MARVIVVTSGKGGVGKTTTSANISTALAMRGYKVAVIDFDVGLRNLDLIMGVERRVVYDFVHVIHGEATLKQALIRDKRVENLYILPASQTRDKEALHEAGVEKVIDELKADGFDFIICDSPAGIETGALMALRFADDAFVVTNPEVSSVRDSDRILGILQAKSKKGEMGQRINEYLVVTRYNPNRVEAGEMLGYQDIVELLAVKFLGAVPEGQEVLSSSNAGMPVVLNAPESSAALAYGDIVSRYLGEDVPQRFLTAEKKGLFARIFS